jgi:serine/threonine-protein phosphatase 2A regulatory subunit B'
MVNLFSTGTKKKKESVVDDQQGNSATLRKPTSLSKQAMAKEMDELPQLRDYPAAKREALFEQKLELCSHVFNFEDVSAYTNHCFNHFFTGSIIEKREGD